jgi:chromosome partitioning protein
MSQIIAIASQKGGVGKTTVALNLGVALAERGKKVLLADLDPQGGVGLSLARGEGSMRGLADWLAGQCSAEEALVPTKLANLTLLPRGRLDPLEAVLFERGLQQSGRLASLIATLQARFDYLLFDTPAGVGMATRVILAAADWALVPVQAEPLGLRSIQQLLRVVEHVSAKENQRLKLLGLLLTMVDLKHDSSRQVAEQLWGGFGGVLDTVIPRAPVFTDASQRGLPLSFLKGPISPEARRFEMLAAEVEAIVNNREGADEAERSRAERQLL